MKIANAWYGIAALSWLTLGSVAGIAQENNSITAAEVPSFIVDANGIAPGGWLNLRNNSSTPASINLRVSDFTNTSTTNIIGARVSFYGQPGGPSLGEQITIPAATNLLLWVQVTNVSEAGESAATLLANGLALGPVTVARWAVPFNISAIGLPTAATNDLVCAERQPVSLVLSNADAFTYKVHWSLTVNGDDVASGDDTIPPYGQISADSIGRDELATATKCPLFEDTLGMAELTVKWTPETTSTMTVMREKVIPFRLRIRPSDSAQGWTSVGKNSLAVVLLILGAAGSWALNLTLPNVKRRGILGGLIAALADRTHSLSTQIDSSLRVLLRVQRLRFLNVLSEGTSWSPATGSSLDTVQAGITSLDRQVTTVERIDRIYDVLVNMKASPIPPTSLAMLEDSINQASRLLRATRPTEADLQSAEALVKDAENRLASIGKSDDALALSIARRAKWVNGQLTDTVLKTPEVVRMQKMLPQLIGAAPVMETQFEQAAAITTDSYLQLDTKARKLELIARYIRVLGNLQDGPRKTAITTREATLMELLALEGFVNVQRAERLVSEMEEGVFAEGVTEELAHPPRAAIEIGQSPARLFEPVQFRVAFRKPEFNTSTARNEFVYEWDFGDGLKEKGSAWTVWHFYRDHQSLPYDVTVAIIGLRDGNPVTTLKEQIKVERPESKNFLFFSDKAWAETTRVALALLAPMLALVAGAREKILQQDTLAASITIFLMGFTANAIKDMLVGSTAANNAAPPPTPAKPG